MVRGYEPVMKHFTENVFLIDKPFIYGYLKLRRF